MFTIACTDAESATSVSAKHGLPARFTDQPHRLAPAGGVDVGDHDLGTSRAKPMADARPIPEAAPVTIATFPAKRDNACLLACLTRDAG